MPAQLPESTAAEMHKLADHALIDKAAERVNAAAARKAKAESDLQAATAAHNAAASASRRAIAGEGDTSPLDAERELEDAARNLNVASKVHEAAAEAHKSAVKTAEQARARAGLPIMAAGIRARVAAARKADRARAMLTEAAADHERATAVLNLAHGYGTPHMAHDVERSRPMGTEATETAIWTANNHDVVTGLSPYARQFTDGVL